MQAASEVGVNQTNGYNGHLTSREAGSVGDQMVTAFSQRHIRTAYNHKKCVKYIAVISM